KAEIESKAQKYDYLISLLLQWKMPLSTRIQEVICNEAVSAAQAELERKAAIYDLRVEQEKAIDPSLMVGVREQKGQGEVQDEVERKAAAYDALLKACKLALLVFKMINSVQGDNGMWRGHPFTITPSFLTEAI